MDVLEDVNPPTTPPPVKQETRDRSQRPRRRALWWTVGIVAALAVGGAGAAVAPQFFAAQSGPSGEALPAGFPDQETLPLAEGKVVEATADEAIPMNVVVEVADADAQTAAVEELVKAGYSEIGQSGSGPNGTVYSLAREGVAVRVEFLHSEADGYRVQYTAAPTAPASSEGGDS